MVTKNEMVAILAALTTDLDAAARKADEDVRKAEAAQDDNGFLPRKDAYAARRQHAG